MRRPLLPAALLALPALLTASPARAQGTPSWQQRVAYEMDIVMDAPAHRYTGRQRLTYTNNSPDTLRQVFYHLYFNAFQPTSMMAERNRHLPDPDARVVPRIWNYAPDEIGYHRVSSLTMDGTAAPFRVDDTVMRVELPRPIAPGGSAVFEMAWDAQVPLQTRRSGWKSREGIDFSMTQWYPKMAQYDSRGWHADPYVGREFYAPFGTYDVRISLPADYTLGATGVLQNAAEIGKGYAPSTEPLVTFTKEQETRPATQTLTWRWRAENVHDFAWAADRDYTHDRIAGPNGRTYHLLYQPNVARGWEGIRGFVPAVIAAMEQRFGPYRWPQFTVAQGGDGGMEYNMLNLVTGGRSPQSLYGVVMHEAAHEWFYGMLASNEAKYAWMDEGFTEFATNEVASALFGIPAGQNGAARGIAELRLRGLAEPFSWHSDHYTTNRAYSTASYGGGNHIADMLGYVLGDSVRDRGFRAYVNRFTFRHPQPADVEATFERVSGLHLDWLFEQLTHTTKSLDYAIADLDRRGGQTVLTFERKGEMVMPLDVKLTMTDGTTRWLTVPTSEMRGAKAVGAGWTVAPTWPWTSPRHTVTVSGDVRSATIDPDQRTLDINRLNDTAGGGWWPVVTDVKAFDGPDVRNPAAYGVGVRPLAQYARDYGFGVGIWTRGGYWMNRHDATAALTLWPLVVGTDGERPRAGENQYPPTRRGYTSWAEGVDYTLRYATTPVRFAPRARAGVAFEKQQGVFENRLWGAWTFGRWAGLGRDRGTLTADIGHLRQPYARAFDLYDLHVWPAEAHRVWAGLRYGAGRRTATGERRFEIGGQVGTSLHDVLTSTTPFDDPTKAWAKALVSRPAGPLTLRAWSMATVGVQRLATDERFLLGTGAFHDVWRHEAARAALSAAGERYTGREVCGVAPPCSFERQRPVVRALSAHGPTGYLALDGALPPTGSRFALTGNVEAESRALHARLPVRAFAYSGIALIRRPSSEIESALKLPRLEADNVYADAGLGLRLALAEVPWLARVVRQSDAAAGARLSVRAPLWLYNPSTGSNPTTGAWERQSDGAFKFRTLFGVELPF